MRVQNICKIYGTIKAVNDLSFTVNQGEIYGLLGPNGSGKSTTIRILLSLIHRDSGNVRLFDENVNTSNFAIRKRIGALVERPDFYNYLSAFKNLELAGRLSRKKITKRSILEKLDWVGLSDFSNRKVKIFSHGIIDTRKIILRLSRNEGKTIVLSSHILKEVEQVADRMLVMQHGKAVVEGNVQELLLGKEKQVKFRVNDPDHAVKILKSHGVVNTAINEFNELVVSCPDKEPWQLNDYLVSAGVRVDSMSPIRTLEDYYLQLTEYAEQSNNG